VVGIRSELLLTAGSAEVVAGLGDELCTFLAGNGDAALAQGTLRDLASLLATRAGPAAEALLEVLARAAKEVPGTGSVLPALLAASDATLRDRAAAHCAELAGSGRLQVDRELLERIAAADEAEPFSSAALADVGRLLCCLPGAVPGGQGAALAREGEPRLRRLGARLLDAEGDPPDADRYRENLGEEAAAFLGPYLDHSRATNLDLIEIATRDASPPACLAGLRDAERRMGPALLREVIARIGWPRLSAGISCTSCNGVSVGGSFPLVMSPEHVRLLGPALRPETLWSRHLVVAHGGVGGDGSGGASDETVQRFRRYNVAHAELLDEILAVEPVDAAKARRIQDLLERVVADFATLFAEVSDDAQRVGAVHERLRAQVQADLERDRPTGPLSAGTVRRIQMFEDPAHLDEVTTLHGLKRYLHQLGLRLAFRLFRAYRGASHTVDLVVTDERQVLRCERVLRYLEFERTASVGTARLPFLVSLLAGAFGRQLLHGRKLPTVTVLGYGNEYQIYVNYRNHPAFVRIDLSPPFRGGMIDLEYFAVSQYEMDQHPDLSLQGIQRVLRELDLDVSKEGFRLRARYDKERAVDLGDVVQKARSLFHLLPYLMDVDWVIGDLDYPAAAHAEIAAAWARFFVRWGVLPTVEPVGLGRRKIVEAIEPDPAGPREVPWDGRGAYRDRFSGAPSETLEEGLRAELDRRGLGTLVAEAAAPRGGWGQLWLEQTVLEPLDAAVARGEVVETPAGLARAPVELFEREHEAIRLAATLAGGGAPLRDALRMATLARAVERQARFRTTGSVQGRAVQAALLPTAPLPIGLFVLRDAQGIVRLALAAEGGLLCRGRPSKDAPWTPGPELDVTGLARALRAHNYLGTGPERGAGPGEEDLEGLRRRLASPSPTPTSRLRPDERVVPGFVASPGRATGFATFHTAGRQPADLDGCVLVARVVRPEDIPWLRCASGIVSTGGGILSHVGLVALELEKPAVIVEGSWSTAPSGAEVLQYRRPQWREAESLVDGLVVVCRHDLRHTEEALVPGDVVVVDGESGGVLVLGHDPQAIALHQDLHLLETASSRLGSARTEEDFLDARGRFLRATYQLERLLGRLERPALARHAVRELLVLPRGPIASEDQGGRSRLVGALLDNPRCGSEARVEASLRVRDLRSRLEAARRAALEDLPHLHSPAEALIARLGVRRMSEALGQALAISRRQGLESAGPEGPVDVDGACRERLEAIRAALSARAAASEGDPSQRWRLRHLSTRITQIDGVLEPGCARTPSPEALELIRTDGERLRRESRRRVFDAQAGGIELTPLVGAKAAALGEIVRVLGPTAVPPWIAVADAAFREVLATPVAGPALERAGLSGTVSLEEAITRVMARGEGGARAQASAVRALWQSMPLPVGLVAEITSAVPALAAPGAEEPFVAVRSSGREEDSEEAAWAGEFDTFLFVRGLDAILEHVKLAWAGFWSERAIDRRRVLGLSPLAHGGGVIVQRMVDARVSGVLHTLYAAAGQLRDLVVNVGLGLGEGVVSGTVEVDQVLVAKTADLATGDLQLRYRIGDKREQVVFDRERGSGTRRVETRYHQRFRAALEYVELCDLVRAAARLEEAFAEPLDVEFAIEGRDLLVLQARPIPLCDAAWRETRSRHPLRAGRAPVKETA
jgi:pyruvate, water dikinase